MKKTLSIIAAALVLVLSLSALSGCGTKLTPSESLEKMLDSLSLITDKENKALGIVDSALKGGSLEISAISLDFGGYVIEAPSAKLFFGSDAFAATVKATISDTAIDASALLKNDGKLIFKSSLLTKQYGIDFNSLIDSLGETTAPITSDTFFGITDAGAELLADCLGKLIDRYKDVVFKAIEDNGTTAVNPDDDGNIVVTYSADLAAFKAMMTDVCNFAKTDEELKKIAAICSDVVGQDLSAELDRILNEYDPDKTFADISDASVEITFVSDKEYNFKMFDVKFDCKSTENEEISFDVKREITDTTDTISWDIDLPDNTSKYLNGSVALTKTETENEVETSVTVTFGSVSVKLFEANYDRTVGEFSIESEAIPEIFGESVFGSDADFRLQGTYTETEDTVEIVFSKLEIGNNSYIDSNNGITVTVKATDTLPDFAEEYVDLLNMTEDEAAELLNVLLPILM